MRTRSVLVLLLLSVALSARAGDVAKNPRVHVESAARPGVNITGRNPLAVVALYEGVFADLSAYYLSGVAAAGYGADLFSNPGAGEDYSGYDLLIVTTADNWWGGAFAAQAALFAAYMDGGGKVVIVGQDWLFGIDDDQFAIDYLGMSSRDDDLNPDDPGDLNWSGTPGGPLEGQSETLSPCFVVNHWYTDRIVPASQGLVTWSSPASTEPSEGGCIGENGLLSTVEFGCGSQSVVGDLIEWQLTTDTEAGTFSSVKALY